MLGAYGGGGQNPPSVEVSSGKGADSLTEDKLLHLNKEEESFSFGLSDLFNMSTFL